MVYYVKNIYSKLYNKNIILCLGDIVHFKILSRTTSSTPASLGNLYYCKYEIVTVKSLNHATTAGAI